ncbi:hypothetical protein Tco_0436441 [Tanacetum coccineum]
MIPFLIAPRVSALAGCDKKVWFAEPVTSSSNILKQTDSLKTKDSNKPLLTSTGVKPTTSASRSKPSGNTKNNRITRPPSSNQKNKVEEHPRKVKSSLNKKNYVSEPNSNEHVKHSMRNDKFESICAICNKCLFDANHDMCICDYVNDVNVRSKSKSKRNKMRKVWKPTGKVFSKIGYSWKPIGRTFTIVRNKCPLTRITSTKVVHTKKTSTKSRNLSLQQRPKATRSVGSSSKVKIVESQTSNSKEPKQSWGSTIYAILFSYRLQVVQIVLWYLDSECSKHMIGNRSQLINFVSKFLGTDNEEKDEKQSQNDKTGLGMEKTVKDKAKSKPESEEDSSISAVQDTNSFAQQDAMILSVFEQLSNQENELLTKTFNVFKNESKEKEAKNIDTDFAMEKKVKELDNIVSLGFQNPFYLKKAQQIRPMLYDGNVIAKETNVILIADSEETLIFEEESRSKMLLKQSDPMVLKQKVNIKPINYAKLNRLSEDFGKRFVPQQELSDKQALHPNTD